MISGKKVVIAVVSLPLLIIAIVALFWNPNWFKSQATPYLSDVESHSIDFTEIEHSLFKPGDVTLHQISVSGPIANGQIGTLYLDANIMDAFSKNIIINEVRLTAPNLKLDMQALNDWLAAQPETPQQTPDEASQILPVKRIYIKDIRIENAYFEDVSTLKQFAVKNLSLVLSELRIAENSQIILLKDNSPVRANLQIAELAAQGAQLGRVDANIKATEQAITINNLALNSAQSSFSLTGSIMEPKGNAKIDLNIADSKLNLADFAPFAAQLPIPLKGTLQLGGTLKTAGQLNEPQSLMQSLISDLKLDLDTGKTRLDIASKITTQNGNADLKLQINDSKINMDEFQALLEDSPVKPSGDLALSGAIDAQGLLEDPTSLLKTLTGNLAMGLNNGKLLGVDVNKIVKGFKDSKESDWKDVGTFLVTGPVGILAANMFDLGAGAATSGGETLIPQLQLHSKMDKGAIIFKDTALATDKYRLAFDGQVNPTQKTFKDFTFALLDKAGCADIKQTLNGNMSSPKSAIAQSLLDSAIAPISGILKSLKNSTAKCTPFYQGDVSHPVN